MNKTLLLFLTFFSVLHLAHAESSTGQKRIVGGTEVNFNESNNSFENGWSAVVGLLNKNQNLFCSASLIDSKWLLTAAHCLYGTDGNVDTSLEITAIFNQRDVSKVFLGNVPLYRTIINTIIHPDYNYVTDNNDLALLELEQAVDSVAPIKLPGKFFDGPVVKEGTLSTVLGWGITQQEEQQGLLRKTQVPVANFDTCVNNYSEQGIDINLNMLCAGYDEGGRDACFGDSGSPLLMPSMSGSGWDQIGIVSFGIGCGLPKFFGVYTRISRHHNFIKNIICDSQAPSPVLNIVRELTSVQINLTADDEDSQSFRVYYAPYPQMTPIKYFEIHNTRTRELTIAEDSQWFAAAQVLDGNCPSGFSDVVTVL